MKQTVTIEIADNSVLQLLRSLASMSLIKFTTEIPSQNDFITARLNEIYNEVDSSLEPCYMMAQAEVLVNSTEPHSGVVSTIRGSPLDNEDW